MSKLAATAVLAAGIAAAFHVGKLPPAISTLRDEFGISLIEASYLISVLQMAAVLLGIFGGMLADRFGAKRVMSLGLALLALASLLAPFSDSAAVLLLTRIVESLGFMLTVLPGPSLLRRCAPARLNRWLGLWAAYMPAGMALGLLLTPFLLLHSGWRSAWWLASGFSLVVLLVIYQQVPPDRGETREDARITVLLGSTLSSSGPWLLALAFGCYAGQWMGVFGFLPTIYRDAGVTAGSAAPLTALAVAINIIGNVVGGSVAQRRMPAPWLIIIAAVMMAAMSWLAFGSGAGFALQYAAIILFSMFGGLIPGALFALVPSLAPTPNAVSTTVGLMQQGSAAGQMLAPPLLAALVTTAGGWSSTWQITGVFAFGNLLIALLMFRLLAQRSARLM